MKQTPLIRFALLATLLVLAGCASPTQPAAMRVDSLALTNKFAQTVAVQTNGGQPTDPMWTSKVSDADLAQAITESLRASGLFSGVVSIDQSDYVLNATIINIDQPLIGFTMSVGIEIVWSLTPKGLTKPVWEKSVTSREQKTTGDAFAGVKRLRLATEAATKENIRKALTLLSQQQLATPASK